MSTTYTLTYSDKFKGFPSFYSYIPDFMIGMNSHFYTFNKGDIYRHNVATTIGGATVPRNNFYGSQYNSSITSVFNEGPLDNKIFKTINLESSFATAADAWSGQFDTDIQKTGFIDASFFEKKEGAWFAYMRNEPSNTALASGTNTAIGANQLIDTSVNFSTLGVVAGDIVLNPSTGKSALVTVVAATILTLDTDIFPSFPQNYSVFDGSPPSELELRSLSGIGACTSVVWSGVAGAATTVNFALTTDIGSVLSIGDQLYAKATPQLIGTVTAITVNLPGGVNSITVGSTIAGSTATATDLILFSKNQTAESYGVLGHFCEFTLTNTATTPVELFAVETEIMKSFP
tara:strand:- start:693 stop:1730 length:1038 start_codon:yes stop_codon:yes gene_type:complete